MLSILFKTFSLNIFKETAQWASLTHFITEETGRNYLGFQLQLKVAEDCLSSCPVQISVFLCLRVSLLPGPQAFGLLPSNLAAKVSVLGFFLVRLFHEFPFVSLFYPCTHITHALIAVIGLYVSNRFVLFLRWAFKYILPERKI